MSHGIEPNQREPISPAMLNSQALCLQARPWEVTPGHTPGEEAPPRTPDNQPIRGFEPRAPVPPGRPPPYPGSPPARGAPRGSYSPTYEQVLRMPYTGSTHMHTMLLCLTSAA